VDSEKNEKSILGYPGVSGTIILKYIFRGLKHERLRPSGELL
jgi:hypothetical protein